MYRRGFTIIELIVCIAVMGILLTLAVVNLRASQLSGRNSERVGDAQTIVQNLENFYVSGSGSGVNGTYPPTTIAASQSATTTALPDLDTKALFAPGQTSSSFIAATTNAAPTANFNQYVYQPLYSDGTLCTSIATQTCRRFNLYYSTENADGSSTLVTLASKNQ
jgi:prepilin-type N-terminal cleavage/methylation domain-containing protein